ncbi:hypothetical protein D1007_06613 [Hordeum vulgare]|nr:hypothetical protein D1007_06613 [Hordeum vulgare]
MPDLPCDGVHGVSRGAIARGGGAAVRNLHDAVELPCLLKPPALTGVAGWACPDCGDEGASHSSAPAPTPTAAPGGAGGGSGLLAAIREIEADATLSELGKIFSCLMTYSQISGPLLYSGAVAAISSPSKRALMQIFVKTLTGKTITLEFIDSNSFTTPLQQQVKYKAKCEAMKRINKA